ncbi:MAG: acyltransferase family protein [Lachnospiraceae bacterium]|nr:acyltransferase family protein [Lachnospiraceae bacterium]
MQEKQKVQRKVHIELLRIAACFSVVMLHSAAQYWYSFPVDSKQWLICNTYDALFRFGVPVFVMISGMLFLGREEKIDIKRLFRKNILRLVVIYLVWSFLYSLWLLRDFIGTAEFSWGKCIEYSVQGRYHLWFLSMLVAIYLLLPILKTWTDHAEKRHIQYFLLLFLILQIGKETLEIFEWPTAMDSALNLINVELAGSYVGYFVLGYYIYKFPPVKKIQNLIYLSGVAGAVLAAVVSAAMSHYYNSAQPAAFDSYSVFTFCVSVAVFVFFQEKVSKIQFSQRAGRIICAVSADTFGIYLIHVMLLDTLKTVDISTKELFGHPISLLWGIPFMAVCCFLISMCVAALLRRIPVVGKYIC